MATGEDLKHLKWAWQNMKKRCNKPTKDAHRYFLRGITYPKKWETFDGFCADMGATYKSGLTLDRIDSNKSYSLDNCRWATHYDQANNTCRNRKFTINGITKNLSQWCEDVSVRPSTVRQRFYVYGWTVEQSLGMSLKERGK